MYSSTLTLEGPTHRKHPATVRGNVQQDEAEVLLHPAQFTSKRLSVQPSAATAVQQPLVRPVEFTLG